MSAVVGLLVAAFVLVIALVIPPGALVAMLHLLGLIPVARDLLNALYDRIRRPVFLWSISLYVLLSIATAVVLGILAAREVAMP